MSVDFRPIIPDPAPTPGRGNYTDLTPFRFWCQKVLPLVYDESLTYYEVLCKVVDYLNKTMEDVGILNTDIETLYDAFTNLTDWTDEQINALLAAYSDLQDYVNNYFDNLDVQEEINNKLDSLASDGTLSALVAPFIPDVVTTWLSTHVSPETGYVIDDTLSIAGAAADAKAAGDEITNLKSDLNKIEEVVEEVQSRNLFNGNTNDGYISANGTINQSTTYKYSDKIDVSEYFGKTLYFGSDGSAITVRFLCAYNENGDAVESEGSDTVISQYTVPSGIKWIVISFSQNPAGVSVEPEYLNSIYTSFYNYTQVKKYPPIDGAINIPKPTIKTADSLSNGQTLSFSGYNSVKRGDQVFSFYCKIPNNLDDNGYIEIGKDDASGYAFGISATKWNYFINGVAQGTGGLHGLTLKDYIAVQIIIKDSDGVAYINIRTNGGTYSRTNTAWSGDHGLPYLFNGCSTTITNVTFAWTCAAFRNRIWIFGDSYVSIANTRWPYYLYDWGFNKNILVSGYGGEISRVGYFDFIETLKYGTPSIAIWAYGMNNTDNGSINADWLTYTRMFIKDCEDKDIVPILATIPCIPNGDNSYKNAWIRSSGYRYIEFANTVNTQQDSSAWYDEMLSNDNVHPAEAGAVALACRAINDVPEIMIN